MYEFYKKSLQMFDNIFFVFNEEGMIKYSNAFSKKLLSSSNFFDIVVNGHDEYFQELLLTYKMQKEATFEKIALYTNSSELKNKVQEFKVLIKYEDGEYTVVGQHLLNLEDVEITEHIQLMNEFIEINRKLQKTEYFLKQKSDEVDSKLEEIEYFANHDELTGVFNRRRILEELKNDFERAKRQSSILSIIIFDLDNFKRINESFGYKTGDEVLDVLIRLVKNRCRSYERLGRYSEDKFIIVLPGVNLTEASALAQSLTDIIENHLIRLESDESISVTISSGLAQIKPFDRSIEDLVKRSRSALSEAKASSKNCVRVRD